MDSKIKIPLGVLAVLTAVGTVLPARFQACSKYVNTSLLSSDVRAEMKAHRVDVIIIASHIILTLFVSILVI